MNGRRMSRGLFILAIGVLFLAALPGCAPAMAPTPANEAPAEAPAITQPAAAEPTAAPEVEKPVGPTRLVPTEVLPQEPIEEEPLVEGRLVELEWPARLRMGESDVIRLALVPTRAGYVARAEFPEHDLQTREVPVPRPNGYELYAIARLDGVGFEISPRATRSVSSRPMRKWPGAGRCPHAGRKAAPVDPAAPALGACAGVTGSRRANRWPTGAGSMCRCCLSWG